MTSKLLKEAFASCLADSVRSMYQAETLLGFIADQYEADKVEAMKDLLSICRNRLWDVEMFAKLNIAEVPATAFRDAVVKVLEDYGEWQGVFAANDVVTHAYVDDRVREVISEMDIVESFEFDDRVQAVIDAGDYCTPDDVEDKISTAIDELDIIIRR